MHLSLNAVILARLRLKSYNIYARAVKRMMNNTINFVNVPSVYIYMHIFFQIFRVEILEKYNLHLKHLMKNSTEKKFNSNFHVFIQVKVMLRVSPGDGGSFFNADKRKKQVTLVDPASGQSSSAEDRRPTVAAPKMFAFDAIFTEEDSQVDYTEIANIWSYLSGESLCSERDLISAFRVFPLTF